jgi:hypothetical protein
MASVHVNATPARIAMTKKALLNSGQKACGGEAGREAALVAGEPLRAGRRDFG